MRYNRERHRQALYEKDMIRWRQGRGPYPEYQDYFPPQPTEGCFVTAIKIGLIGVFGVLGITLAGLFAVYFVIRMITA